MLTLYERATRALLHFIYFIITTETRVQVPTCVGIVESTVNVITLRFPAIVALVRWGIYKTRGRHLLYKHRTYIHLFTHIAVVII